MKNKDSMEIIEVKWWEVISVDKPSIKNRNIRDKVKDFFKRNYG